MKKILSLAALTFLLTSCGYLQIINPSNSSSSEVISSETTSEIISEISSEITTSIIDSIETSEFISSEYISSLVTSIVTSELSSEGVSSEIVSEVTSSITSSIIESIQTSEVISSEVISSIVSEIVTSELSSIINSSTSSGSSSEESSSAPEEDNSFKLDAPNFDTPEIDSIENVTFEDLFNLGNKISIKAYVSNSELNKLADDQSTGGKVQTYRRCDKVVITMKNHDKTFTWEYENVGIRQKGNTSRQPIWGNDGLNLNHFKLAFDETFSDTSLYGSSYVSQYGDVTYEDREFLDSLSGIDIKWNKNYDQTHIKEVYSSYLYQASGIISSHIGLTEFSIVNDGREYSMGLCSLYEPASKSLIKRSLKNENKTYLNMPTWDEEKAGIYGIDGKNYGDYYECGWGAGDGRTNSGADWSIDSISGARVGEGNQAGTYIPAYERKTCTTIPYNHERLKNLINKTNSGTYSQIESVMDLEEFAVKEAVTYYLGNPDGMRYNYNNYMIYIRRTDGKAIIVPIDNDRCFGVTKDWNVRDALKDEKPLSKKDCSGSTVRNPLFTKTILSNSPNAAKDKYIETVLAIRNSSWVKNATFNEFYNKAKSTYSNHYFSLSDDNISFSDYISSKNKAVDAELSNQNGGNDNDNIQDTTRIYFENTNNWSSVYCYVYGDYGDNGWPGVKMTKAGTRNGYDIYSYDFDTSEYTHIMFTNGTDNDLYKTEKLTMDYVEKSTLFYIDGFSNRGRPNLYSQEINISEIK